MYCLPNRREFSYMYVHGVTYTVTADSSYGIPKLKSSDAIRTTDPDECQTCRPEPENSAGKTRMETKKRQIEFIGTDMKRQMPKC